MFDIYTNFLNKGSIYIIKKISNILANIFTWKPRSKYALIYTFV